MSQIKSYKYGKYKKPVKKVLMFINLAWQSMEWEYITFNKSHTVKSAIVPRVGKVVSMILMFHVLIGCV